MSHRKIGGQDTSWDAIAAPLKCHVDGGKSYLAKRIAEISTSVPHLHFVETHCGTCAVTLARNPDGYSEVVNDLSRDLTGFWDVLRDAELFYEFRRRVEASPFSQVLYEESEERHGEPSDPITGAYWFFVRCRMSLAGRMDSFAPISRTRTRRRMNEQASAWLTSIEGLDAVHDRMKRVVVLCMDGTKCIKQQDGPDTMFYIDPPYCQDTRTAKDVYEHEMTDQQHVELLDTLLAIKGKAIISGYDSPLYAEKLKDWHLTTYNLPNNSAGGTKKRRMTEFLWFGPKCNWPVIDK